MGFWVALSTLGPRLLRHHRSTFAAFVHLGFTHTYIPSKAIFGDRAVDITLPWDLDTLVLMIQYRWRKHNVDHGELPSRDTPG